MTIFLKSISIPIKKFKIFKSLKRAYKTLILYSNKKVILLKNLFISISLSVLTLPNLEYECQKSI